MLAPSRYRPDTVGLDPASSASLSLTTVSMNAVAKSGAAYRMVYPASREEKRESAALVPNGDARNLRGMIR